MASFKQFKTPKLGVVVQVTETTPPGSDGRRWEVHDVERNRGFRVALASPAGSKRPLAEAEIEAAIGRAIERALVEPPEKLPGGMYEVDVTSHDLKDGSR